jgi:hypothetical protein
MVILKEQFEDIGTVGELREALADLPDDFPISDSLECPIQVIVWEDTEFDDCFATIVIL